MPSRKSSRPPPGKSASSASATTRFPRTAKYHPDWITSCVSGGANSLWLTEWLCESLDLRPGMRVLDLGCGRAASSIFLHREFGVQVWATDLWFSVTENEQRVKDARAQDGVFPFHADARALPFAGEFFDAIVSIDSFPYYGTDETYLAYIARYLKPGGTLAIAGAGLMQEIPSQMPEHLRPWWTHDLWVLHAASWWQHHWDKTGIVRVLEAGTMPDGWQRWLEWHHLVAPGNAVEITALEKDRGRYLGYVRVIAQRTEMPLDQPVVALPAAYEKKPLLRDNRG
jgi:ubiquinone/menaquinone biosynthesis C-methylase UbiE